MPNKEQRFLKKNFLTHLNVMYLTRIGRKTVVHKEDGTTVETFLTLNGLLNNLSEGFFDVINKGVAISPRFLDSAQNNVYTMKDGTVFKGRVRMSKKEQQNVLTKSELLQENPWKQYGILENLPFAFCVIEIVFDQKYRATDFIFRYCNKEMEFLEGKSRNVMVNKSFYEVFKNGDKKWLMAYADVAINGGNRIIEGHSREINMNLRVYCYQIKPSICGCLLLKI